eukprot:3202642-Amphidinium_carterae.1
MRFESSCKSITASLRHPYPAKTSRLEIQRCSLSNAAVQADGARPPALLLHSKDGDKPRQEL